MVKKINVIVAIDSKTGAIGYNGKMIYNCKEDLNYFKSTTLNSVVIMGRKTFESINSKPLPKRYNVVLTSKYKELNTRIGIEHKNLIFLPTLDDALEHANKSIVCNFYANIFVIGGEKIYEEIVNHKKYIVDRFFITTITDYIKDEETSQLKEVEITNYDTKFELGYFNIINNYVLINDCKHIIEYDTKSMCNNLPYDKRVINFLIFKRKI